jgi:hypothetical protein
MVLAALGIVVAAAQQPIRGWIDDVRGFADDGGGGFEVHTVTRRTANISTDRGYRGVRELARELNANGFDCRQIVVDAENEYISTGSCQAHMRNSSFPIHVQINIYSQPATLDFALESLKDAPFDLVYGDNWFVSSTPNVVRKVHQAIGGRLKLAS